MRKFLRLQYLNDRMIIISSFFKTLADNLMPAFNVALSNMVMDTDIFTCCQGTHAKSS